MNCILKETTQARLDMGTLLIIINSTMLKTD